MSALRIDVEHVFPPVPFRDCDWRATFDGYEPGALMGYGRTKDRAVDDLLERAIDAGLIEPEDIGRIGECEVMPLPDVVEIDVEERVL